MPKNNHLVTKIFNEPKNLDFSFVAGILNKVGAPLSVFNNLKAKADRYGIAIAPTNWQLDPVEQTKAIVESAPAGSVYDWSKYPEK